MDTHWDEIKVDQTCILVGMRDSRPEQLIFSEPLETLTLNIILSLYRPPSQEEFFFPGMAHSHIIKFIVPSEFLTGFATNPYG